MQVARPYFSRRNLFGRLSPPPNRNTSVENALAPLYHRALAAESQVCPRGGFNRTRSLRQIFDTPLAVRIKQETFAIHPPRILGTTNASQHHRDPKQPQLRLRLSTVFRIAVSPAPTPQHTPASSRLTCDTRPRDIRNLTATSPVLNPSAKRSAKG